MVRDVIDRIKGSQVVRNMMTLSLGTIISQVIPIILSPILARLYSPDDFGLWGIFSSTAIICSIFMTGRYELAILRPKEDKDALTLVRLCLLITALILCIISGAYIVGKSIGYFDSIGIAFFLSLILYLLFNSITQIISYFANREERYKKIAKGSISRSTVQGLTRLGFGAIGLTRMGLIYGTILGVMSNVAVLATPQKKLKDIFRKEKWAEIKKMAYTYRRFPIYEMPSSGLNSLSTNLPLILLALYFSESEIGYFSMAVSLMFLPINFITTAQSQVYYKRTCVIQNQEEIGSLTAKIFSINFMFGAIALTIFELFAGLIFSVFLGERWQIAGNYAACFAPWILMVVSFSPISTIFLLRDKQQLAFLFNLSLLTARVLAVLIGGLLLKSMLSSMILYGLVGFIIWIAEGICILKLSYVSLPSKRILLFLSTFLIYITIWILKMYSILN